MIIVLMVKQEIIYIQNTLIIVIKLLPNPLTDNMLLFAIYIASNNPDQMMKYIKTVNLIFIFYKKPLERIIIFFT